METTFSKQSINFYEKVAELCKLGRLAKQVGSRKNAEDLKDKIYLQMAVICNDLREFEPEFKVVYPMLADLYDNLLAFYDHNNNKR